MWHVSSHTNVVAFFLLNSYCSCMKKIACCQLSLSLSLSVYKDFAFPCGESDREKCQVWAWGDGNCNSQLRILVPLILFRVLNVAKAKICALPTPTYRDFHANITRKCRMDWLTEAVTKLLRSASVIVHSWIPNKHSQSLCTVRAGIWYQLSRIICVWGKKSHLLCCNPSSLI
jgi:hypothetical protein